jgi:hypothetical protein
VSLLGRSGHAFALASVLAALGLIVGNCALLWHEDRAEVEAREARA